MFHDVKSAPSPSKGKLKEDAHWRTGWWDFYPLIDHPRRPIQWSNCSIIFTPHPTRPLLTARHFSSSKQFEIPSPSPIAASPSSYDPPSIISVAPGDDWLFAYFPRRDNDGTACLWNRGEQIDSWSVKEYWSYARDAGVVAASWLGTPREWALSTSRVPTRLPPRGPPTPVSSPTLLLVTQDHQVNVCYIRNYIPSLKILTRSILQPGVTVENQPSPSQSHLNESYGVRRCVNAAIGLGYNELSILVATRSHIFPTSTSISSQHDSINLDLSVDLTQQNFFESKPTEWETWGEESIIDLCEIQLKYDGLLMGVIASPISPLYHSGVGLTNINFICMPSQSNTDKGKIYLATSYVDFGDYTSTPKSELNLHSITQHTVSPNGSGNNFVWKIHHEATRTFASEVVAFFIPSVTTSQSPVIHTGILNTSGSLSRRASKVKEVRIGTVKALSIPDLSDSNDWKTSPIVSAFNKAGRELPLNAVTSSNGTLLCTIPSSPWTSQVSIHSLPMPREKEIPLNPSLSTLSQALALAILSRRNAADLIRILSLPSVAIEEVADTLYQTIDVLEAYRSGSTHALSQNILGLAVEIYKTRASHAIEDNDRIALTARWQCAHDICSLIACNAAFEDCRDGETYDLEAVWELIALSSWVVSFIEKVMKECVLSCDVDWQGLNEAGDDRRASRQYSPILFHLVHPIALTNVISALTQVKLFRSYLGTLSARGENSQIARDVLIDVVDSCGIDFAALESLLREGLKEAETLTVEQIRKGLAACYPTTDINKRLHSVIKNLTQSAVMDKPALFIRPADLVDGATNFPILGLKKYKNKDVVSKGTLLKRAISLTCLRCAGKSEIGSEKTRHTSVRWRTWEKMWTLRCICGGFWVTGSTSQM